MDSRMEYVTAKNTNFLIRKNCMFDQFLTRVYEVLQINPNEYSITIKTTLKSSNTIFCVCSLPMDIFNNEMVNFMLHMTFDVANYGCIPIFVTISPRVLSQDLKPHVEIKTSFRANMFGLNIQEEVLPRMMSLQQYYSPLHDNNDNIYDNDIMLVDVGEEVLPLTTSLEQRYSLYYNNDDPIDDISNTEADNVYVKPSNSTRGTHFNSACDDGGVSSFNIPVS